MESLHKSFNIISIDSEQYILFCLVKKTKSSYRSKIPTAIADLFYRNTKSISMHSDLPLNFITENSSQNFIQFSPSEFFRELNRPENLFLKSVRSKIEARLDDASFDVVSLAKEMNLSRSQLFRKIKLKTGKSIRGYIQFVRLEHGKRLLETTGLSISEIAYRVGFTDPGYFSKKFRKTYGYSPSDKRKNR